MVIVQCNDDLTQCLMYLPPVTVARLLVLSNPNRASVPARTEMAKKIGLVVYTVNPRLVAYLHIFTEKPLCTPN